MRRVMLWGSLGLVLVAALAVWLLPRWLSGDGARERVQAILSEALGREVTIESLDIGREGPVIELHGVRVAQPQALAVPEEGPLLYAEHIRLEVGLEQLLERRVVGSAMAEGVTMIVLERGGQTSVHGLGKKREGAGPKRPPPELALDIELRDVALRLVDLDRDEAIDVRDIGLRGTVSNRPGDEHEAIATLTAAAVEVRGVALQQVMMQLRLDDAAVELVRLRATLGQGSLTGHGRLGRPAKGSSGAGDWSLDVSFAGAQLDGPLRDVAATFVPSVVRATGTPGTATTGELGATVQLRGEGLRWATIEPSLRGQASLALHDVVVPADAMILELAALAGRESGPWPLGEVVAEVSVDDGWLRPESLVMGELRPKIEGRVSLQGELDLRTRSHALRGAFRRGGVCGGGLARPPRCRYG